jgi:apolipoprotein N-acyltransferase
MAMSIEARPPRGQVAAPARADLRARLLFPAAGLTGLLMVLAFPACDHDYLLWLVLVPLFWTACGAGPGRGFLAGWLSGFTLVCGGFYWVLSAMRAFSGLGRGLSEAMFLPWVLYESLPWGILGLCLGALRSTGRPAPGRIFWLIPIWVAVEHYYPHIFPWHVGGGLYRSLLAQTADLFGASGLTALVLLVNAVIFLGLLSIRREVRFPWKSLCLMLALLGVGYFYGWFRLRQVDAALAAAPELRVAMVQPVAMPREKKNPPFFFEMEQRTRALIQREKVDLAVWPEGTDTVGWIYNDEGQLIRAERNIQRQTGFEKLTVPLVAGSWSYSFVTMTQKNTAAYVEPQKWPPGFYHKNVRVLFGEYIPLLEHLPTWFREKIPNAGTIEAGTECPLFELPGGPYRFRILICYEAILPGFVRHAERDADFLVNVTEDIWYGKTSHVGQHLSVLMLRAIENRISIARAANAGPSGVIDPAGRMRERTVPFEKSEGVFSLRPAHLGTFYAQLGFAFPGVCIPVGVVFLWRLLRQGWRAR